MHSKQPFLGILCGALARVTTAIWCSGYLLSPPLLRTRSRPSPNQSLQPAACRARDRPCPYQGGDRAQFRFDPCNAGFNPFEFILSPATG